MAGSVRALSCKCCNRVGWLGMDFCVSYNTHIILSRWTEQSASSMKWLSPVELLCTCEILAGDNNACVWEALQVDILCCKSTPEAAVSATLPVCTSRVNVTQYGSTSLHFEHRASACKLGISVAQAAHRRALSGIGTAVHIAWIAVLSCSQPHSAYWAAQTAARSHRGFFLFQSWS